MSGPGPLGGDKRRCGATQAQAGTRQKGAGGLPQSLRIQGLSGLAGLIGVGPGEAMAQHQGLPIGDLATGLATGGDKATELGQSQLPLVVGKGLIQQPLPFL